VSEDDGYMNIGEVAEALGVTRKTVYSMVKSGKLTAIPNPIDSREKLIERTQVEALARFARSSKKAAA
jgi:excisionase family DNA binding protein